MLFLSVIVLVRLAREPFVVHTITGATLITSYKLLHLPKAPRPTSIPLRVKISTNKFGRENKHVVYNSDLSFKEIA